MKYMQSLLFVLLIAGSVRADDLPVVLGRNTSHEALFKEGNSYFTELNGVQRRIDPVYIDKALLKLSPDQLKTALSNDCYLNLTRFVNSDDYKLELKGRLKGGGPIFAICTFFVGSALVIMGTYKVGTAGQNHAHQPGVPPMEQPSMQVGMQRGFGGATMATGGIGLVLKATAAALAAPTW